MKLSVIKLEGKANADWPLQIEGYLANDMQQLFQVDGEFGLYTEGQITGRKYFGKICRGTWYAYEFAAPDGQKNVVLQRMY